MPEQRSSPAVTRRAGNEKRIGMRGDKTREARFLSRLASVCKASRTRRQVAGVPDESP
jgi:hypothetical protein